MVAFWAIVVAVVVTTLSMPADVVGDPRLHLAGPRPREERQRHALQVAVDGGAQVVHDPLADLVRDVRLPDAERRRAIAIAIIAATSSVSSVVLCWRIPSSSTSRSRNGEIMLSPDEKTISASTRASRPR